VKTSYLGHGLVAFASVAAFACASEGVGSDTGSAGAAAAIGGANGLGSGGVAPDGLTGGSTAVGGGPGLGGTVVGSGGVVVGSGGVVVGSGGVVVGSGGVVVGSGGVVVGSGGAPVGFGGDVVGSGGDVVGSGGDVVGSGGVVVGSGGDVVGSGGDVVGSGGDVVGFGGDTGIAGAGTGGDGTGGEGTGGSDAGPCPSSGTLTAGNNTMSLTVGGNEYPMIVHAPPSYDGTTRLPVVFDFHGLGGDETQMQFLSGWASLGDTEGFITVFPGGVDNAWNAGLCCSSTPTDVEFVRAAIDTLNSEACIDIRRVYASGCSNGGGMSFRLACEAADVIAAVAPVDFDCVVGAGCGECSPARPITEVQFRGTDDSMVPYEGSGAFSGAQNNLATWGDINQCTGSPAPLQQNSSCEAYPTCADGVQTILCTVQGGSHCGSYSSFSIAQVAWGIIQNYALP